LKQLKVILSGGGTGGHIFPAVAIAQEIKKAVPTADILFVGAIGRMEMEKVPAAGYQIEGVHIAGLQRRLTVHNLKLPWLVIRSLLQCRRIIRQFKPDVVVGTGGYVSGPVLYTAMRQGIPALIQEQNSYAGITNKLLAKRARMICVAYEGMEKFFPAEKIKLTGNPVRSDIMSLEGKKNEAVRYFNLDPSKKTILVIGGSLGARSINEAVYEGMDRLVRQGVQVIWQTGKIFHNKVKDISATHPAIHAHDFITRMDMAYAAADLVISRAGAGSVSELCLAALPAILVPSPNVAEDHQTKNAEALGKKNAAVIISDANATRQLVDAVIALSADDSQLRTLSNNIRALALKDSARVIAAEVLKISGYSS
jgi:UDP-N-acetylglucosamine--N-acetylmuramyl-(pentapeptide) pyrophosphoryl-undecaprenol N-acetylglucosamine transferase